MVVGVGPALGSSIARRFAREGYAIGLLARSPESVKRVEAEIVAVGGKACGVTADAGDAGAMKAAFLEVTRKLGPVDVLVYNAAASQPGGVMELTAEKFEAAWKTNCLGAFLAVQQAVPAMIERGKGTILFTGGTASLRSSARFSAMAVGKFGLRALAQSLGRELGPQGIHVAHVIVDGVIDSPKVRAASPNRAEGSVLSPVALAETFWMLHAQEPSVWTQELDVRPSTAVY